MASDTGPERLPAGPRRILIAPDKFKGSLSALSVAEHLRTGLRRVRPEVETDLLPVADGGEGTVQAALAAGYSVVELSATGPLGEPVTTRYAVHEDTAGRTAVIEMAAVSGLEMLEPDDATARHATSRGLGELVAHALDNAATTVVIGVGGSASTDGGAGMISALGAELHGPDGALADGGDALRGITKVELDRLHPRLAEVELVLAGDVDNPLLGGTGAAAVYGPQKGADAQAVADLEGGLRTWVHALVAAGRADAADLAEQAGAGAAGGVGYACLLLGATRRPGVDVVLDLTGFADRVEGADLVLTGEGNLDEQSLHGKTPVGVAQAAAAAGVRTVAVCGRTGLSTGQAQAAGFSAVHALTDLEPDVARCIAEAGPLLEQLAEQIGAQMGSAASGLDLSLPRAVASPTSPVAAPHTPKEPE